MASVWTQADADNIRTAVRECTLRGVASLSINGRQITYTSIKDLMDLLNQVEAEIMSVEYGGSIPVKFNPMPQG
jgi:hypothetical protein